MDKVRIGQGLFVPRRDVPRLCSFKATRSIFLLGFFATGTGLATISILFPFCKVAEASLLTGQSERESESITKNIPAEAMTLSMFSNRFAFQVTMSPRPALEFPDKRFLCCSLFRQPATLRIPRAFCRWLGWCGS